MRHRPINFLLGVLTVGLLSGCFEGPSSNVNHTQAQSPASAGAFPKPPDDPAPAHDWPNWRGPNHDGISTETNWLADWPPSGPPQLWKASVGIGFSSVSVSRGRLYTMGYADDEDTVYCLDTETGEEIWTFSYPSDIHDRFYEGGPSATPTVDGAVVYTLSKAGDLFCFEAATGTVVWSKNLQDELGAKSPTWGFAGSPLVEGDRLIVNVGQFGTALNKKSGEVIWTTGTDAAGYASPVPFDLGQERALAMFGGEYIAGVAMQSGEVLWQYPWETRSDINVADPIISGNRVFVSSGYGVGSALIRFENGDTELLWETTEMRNHFNSCVLVDGYLYGIDGQAGDRRAEVKCLELESGDVQWSRPITGTGTLTVAGDKMIVLSGTGQLITAEVSPEQFEPISRAQVLGGKCWIVPVLANAKIYCRNAQGTLICLDVSQTPARDSPESQRRN